MAANAQSCPTRHSATSTCWTIWAVTTSCQSRGLLASTAVLAGLAGAEQSWLVASLVVAAAITFGATLVPGMALLTRGTDAAGLDGVLAIALANLAWAVGNAVGSPLCGWLADHVGDTITYAVFAVLCLGLFGVLRRRRVAFAHSPS